MFNEIIIFCNSTEFEIWGTFFDTPKFYSTMWLVCRKKLQFFLSLYNLHSFSRTYSSFSSIKSFGIQHDTLLNTEKHTPNKAKHVRCMLFVLPSLPSPWLKKAWKHYETSYGSGFLSTSPFIKIKNLLNNGKIMLIINWYDWIDSLSENSCINVKWP